MIVGKLKIGLSILCILFACQAGKPKLISELPDNLKELSAAEVIIGSSLVWSIEDSGHDPILYGFDTYSGELKKTIEIVNAENNDWEELTSDSNGNLYIGDIGNNHGKRKIYTIYKVDSVMQASGSAKAEEIHFTLPKKQKNLDFEAFFLYEDNFYLFSKESGKVPLMKVPNEVGTHKAALVTEFNLEGSGNRITAADINGAENKIVLLNHDKIWVLSNFSDNDFFSGER